MSFHAEVDQSANFAHAAKQYLIVGVFCTQVCRSAFFSRGFSGDIGSYMGRAWRLRHHLGIYIRCIFQEYAVLLKIICITETELQCM